MTTDRDYGWRFVRRAARSLATRTVYAANSSGLIWAMRCCSRALTACLPAALRAVSGTLAQRRLARAEAMGSTGFWIRAIAADGSTADGGTSSARYANIVR